MTRVVVNGKESNSLLTYADDPQDLSSGIHVFVDDHGSIERVITSDPSWNCLHCSFGRDGESIHLDVSPTSSSILDRSFSRSVMMTASSSNAFHGAQPETKSAFLEDFSSRNRLIQGILDDLRDKRPHNVRQLSFDERSSIPLASAEPVRSKPRNVSPDPSDGSRGSVMCSPYRGVRVSEAYNRFRTSPK
eukprot:ANDGO_07622.mRNA.1 hypothetical protein